MSNVFAASKPTLTYFDLYGRGEAIRMALAHSKTEFEDSRVSGETWAAFKASGKCNNGQIPVLEVNGQALNQSEAIIRFVGSQVRPPPLAAATGCYTPPASAASTLRRWRFILPAFPTGCSSSSTSGTSADQLLRGSQVGSYNTADPFAMWKADAVIASKLTRRYEPPATRSGGHWPSSKAERDL
jgi:hypothetical protein